MDSNQYLDSVFHVRVLNFLYIKHHQYLYIYIYIYIYNHESIKIHIADIGEMGSGLDSLKRKPLSKESEFYGVLDLPNIRRVCFGAYEFDTWYGNAAYFASDRELGTSVSLISANGVENKSKSRKRSVTERVKTLELDKSSPYWLDKLYVCDYCFKYTDVELNWQSHRASCRYATDIPPIGTLMYKDVYTPYIITRVRGFKDELFAQNLCLFGKLFLDNKSVYYNVDQFDFYIIYGQDDHLTSHNTPHFKPMGFFSKEVTAWDSDNNLACICVFPPYQRRRLGSLLIEFLYELAAVTPGQALSGPEFPLSPYGKLSYLRFWSKRLAVILYDMVLAKVTKFNLTELAKVTGFRKEDILMTLEFMETLCDSSSNSKDNIVEFSSVNLGVWCKENKVNVNEESRMLNTEFLIL